MAKFNVSVPVDYVQGHLRYGHMEYVVEADSEQEAVEKAKKDKPRGHLVVDDYSVEDRGSELWDEAKANYI